MTTLATWFHCSAKPISRGKGRSAVAAAAYRLGVCLHDERCDLVHDYTRRGGIVTGFTMAPVDAPGWASDPAQLWNAVEAKENRKNSQTALEWEVALPNELDDPAREAIARTFSQWLVDTYGVAVSTGIHRDGQRPNGPNDHMHVEMTTRAFEKGAWAKNKLRAFNCRPGQSNPEIERVREQMASFINDALADAGSELRVSHLSYEALGIDKKPTTHLGPAASEMERRDPGSSDLGKRNRDTTEYNALVDELAALDLQIAAAEEDRLDELYGPSEPEEAVSRPPASRFDHAIQPTIESLDASSEADHGPPVAAASEQAPPRSFEAAIGAADDAIMVRHAVTEPEVASERIDSSAFDRAVQPAVAFVVSGEASIADGRRWKRLLDIYRHGTARLAEIGRDTLGSWQRFVRRGADRRHDGPER